MNLKKRTMFILFSVMCCVGYMVFEYKVFNNNSSKPRKKVLLEAQKLESIDTFMQKYKAIHEKRKLHIKEMCRFHRNDIPKMKTLPRMLVNEKHKMVYCQIPKTGTVSWSRIMLLLAGYKNYTEVMKMHCSEVSAAWKTNVSLLSTFSEEKQKKILDASTRFMFVRHPFSRLLSAFNDKLSPEKENYGKFQDVYNTILKRFRWNKRGVIKNKKVQFKDFINMVIDGTYTKRGDHWREMHTICFPCDIDYDVIGRFEDMEHDSKYILTLLNVTDLVPKFPSSSGEHMTNSSRHDKILKAYYSLPAPLLAEIYKKFKYDFTLFGYKVPIALP